jgi:D-lyxose ketol-isomerase
MKKLLILSAVFIMSAGATFAQDNMSAKQDHMSKMHKTMKDCVMMKDGKMWMMKGGKSMEMTQTMTMSNGTMVMADGSVKTKDGKTMMMKDGESMSMSGKMKKMMKKEGGM